LVIRQLIRVGVDTGGTFTDFVFERDGRLNLFKVPSTPSDPSLAIQQGLARICDETGARLDRIEVVHGTTVGTNALLQRKGARTALVTNFVFSVTDQERSIFAENERKQRARFTTCFRHTGIFQYQRCFPERLCDRTHRLYQVNGTNMRCQENT